MSLNLNFKFNEATWEKFYEGIDIAPKTSLQCGDFIDSDGDEYYIEFLHNKENDEYNWIIYYEDQQISESMSDSSNELDLNELKKVKRYMRDKERPKKNSQSQIVINSLWAMN